MLTGEPPFTGATVQTVVAKAVSAEPERPSLIRKAVPPHGEVTSVGETRPTVALRGSRYNRITSAAIAPVRHTP
jgi:hypothetical protein